MKLHSIYLFRYHIVFYLGNVYNNMALSSTDGSAGDRSVLSLCMSCDINAVHSIERCLWKGTETPSHGESRLPYTNAQPLFFSISNIYLLHLYTCGHVLAMAHMWRSEANLWELVLFFYSVGSRDRTQVLRQQVPLPNEPSLRPQTFCLPKN